MRILRPSITGSNLSLPVPACVQFGWLRAAGLMLYLKAQCAIAAGNSIFVFGRKIFL
jgi:hypothetical protein